MARRKSSSGGSRSRKRNSTPENGGTTWDEIVIQRLLPWRVELAGWLLFIASMLTIFGMAGLIDPGNLLNGWFRLWRHLAGWGAYPFFLSLAAVGLFVAFRRADLPVHPRMIQMVGLELMLVSALALTYHWTNGSLPLANQGRSGGLIGWALAEPALEFVGPILTDGFYLLLFLYGLALITGFTWEDGVAQLRRAADRLQAWAAEVEAPLDAAPEMAAEPEGVPPPVVNQRGSGLAPAALADNLSILGEDGGETAETGRRDPRLPPYDLLIAGGIITMSKEEIDQKKAIIEQTLTDFGLVGTVTEVRRGPAVTQFGVQPGYLERTGPDGEPKYHKVRVSQIANLNRDLALALQVPRLRIQAPVPGRGIVGVEVPNAETAIVRLHSLITSLEFQKVKAPLGVCLGLDVSGAPQVTDLARMPHLLVAGTTGSGKSVFINALVSCLICNNTPEQLRLVMIDPKKVELIRFNGLPHLLGDVEVEHERVIGVLQWLVSEMDRRYREFAEVGARDLKAYNRAVHRYKNTRKLPYIAVFIDELADLMAVYPAEVEKALCRLAQMARATGIHLVVATQRPSTDVITGLIKANFPARASFAVASNTDSRVILDTTGAESLLGRGDMLFLPPEASMPNRIQGCFVGDTEIDDLVSHWKKVTAQRATEGVEEEEAPWEKLLARQQLVDDTDDMLEKAVALAQKYDNLSTSLIQRRLRVGFPRAARLMESLYELGMVEDPKEGGKTRKTLVDEDAEDPLGEYLQENGES